MENLPERIGRFDVVFPLETGAVASILVGRVAEPGAAPVTIKRIAPGVTQGKNLEAFLERAREAVGLRHPNIVAVRDVIEEDETVCVIMEYLEGETATSVLRRLDVEHKSLGFALAAHVVSQAAAGIEAGHAHGMLHEHLTTHDVFIGHDGTVKVFDIGISRAVGEMAGAATIAARELPYASPERCKGEKLDQRSDVYALGVVLWELMMGVSPFDRGSETDILRAILSEDPKVGSTSVLRSLPTELSEIVLRAMDREPANRFPTAKALREELVTFVATQPLGSEPNELLAMLMQNIFAKRIRNNARLLRRADSNRNVAVTSPLAVEAPPPSLDPGALERPTAEAFVPQRVPIEPEPPSLEPAALALPTPDSIPLPSLPTVQGFAPLPIASLPVEAEPAATSATAIPEPAPPKIEAKVSDALPAIPSRPRWQLPVIAFGVVALIVLAVFAFRKESPLVPPVAIASALPRPPASIVAPPSPPAPTPAVIASTTLKIETVPSKATIVIDGSSIGVSPMDVKVPRGEKAIVVELRRAGYQIQRESVVPDIDQKLRLSLVPLQQQGPRVTATATTSAAPPPPVTTASAEPYHRFD